jgi:selenocysteine-specific elongation factor
MIVATAGHVDHGKTTLIKALTGVDTDRLEEEKRRGMSIDLGFAYADLGGDAPIGFVDVPGHEKFVRNMLAGVAAIDFALLVVAADDGPMPQTAEHLAILDLLGVTQGAVALTKIDRVPPERVAQARAEIVALLAPTALRNARVFPVVASTGEGIDLLRDHLTAAHRAFGVRPTHGNFRMAVDRCFSLAGTGLVVTGAVFSGAARIDDQVVISPHGTPARVRGIHAMNQPADMAGAGLRCALNLAGADLKRIDIARGDWIVAPPAHAPTTRIDVQVSVCASESRPLQHWTPVHLHAGAASVNARIAPLEGRAIAPGASGLAQLVLDAPVGAVRGDRFILRDQSARRTIAGGMVIDPFGPARGRSKPARLVQLAAMAQPAPANALAALLDAEPAGVNLDRFGRAWNLTSDEAQALHQIRSLKTVATGEGMLGIALHHWTALCSRICGVLRNWHAEHPESLGLTEPALAAQLDARMEQAMLRAAIKSLIEQQIIVRDGPNLHMLEHRATLSGTDEAFLAKISAVLKGAGIRPPIVGELARMLDIELPVLISFLERASSSGRLVRVAKNRFFLPATVAELTRIAAMLASESADGTFDAALFRDRSGIGRNLTIEVLEFFDRAGVTRFGGGRRSMTAPGSQWTGSP